jgi:biotin carboxyl carrier protein
MNGCAEITKKHRMYEISVNEKEAIKLEEGHEFAWDLQEYEPGKYHILKEGKSYRVTLVASDEDSKNITLLINGRDYQVHVKDRYDILLEKLGMDQMAGAAVDDIKAPMPGLVLQVNVEPGQELQKGDQVLILEAMKMENVIKSPGDGVVKAVKVKEGDAVEKGSVMVEME